MKSKKAIRKSKKQKFRLKEELILVAFIVFSVFVLSLGDLSLTSYQYPHASQDYLSSFDNFVENGLVKTASLLTGASVGETELGIQAGIGGCAQINVSGTYTLTGDYVTSSGYAGGTDCFIIGASNVVLDGAGYTVTDNATGRGVTLSDDTASNITIQNLGLTTFSNFMDLGSENNSDITVDGVTINSTQSGSGADGGIYSFGPNVTFKNSIFYQDAQAMNNCPVLSSTSTDGSMWSRAWNITNNTFVFSDANSIDSAICLYNNTGSVVADNIFNYTGAFENGPNYPGNYDMVRLGNTSGSTVSGNTFINTGNSIVVYDSSSNNLITTNDITLNPGLSLTGGDVLYSGGIRITESNNNNVTYNNVSGTVDDAIKLENSTGLVLTENRITDSGGLSIGFVASLSPITVDGTVCDDAVLFELEVVNDDNTYVSGVYSSINYDVVCRRMDDGVANETVYFPTAGGINCENNAPPILKGGTCMGYVTNVFLNNSATTSFTYNTTAFANPTNGTSVNVSTGSTYPPYLNYSLTAFTDFGLWLVNATGTLTNNYFVNGSFLFDPLSSVNFTFTNDSVAEIQWNSLSDVSMFANLSNNDNVYLSNNLAGVNTESGDYNALNTSAQITLYSLNDTTHYLLKDGVRCDDSGICNISSDGTTLIANVSSFSNYTTQEAAVDASPNVTLISPANNYQNDTAALTNLTFECNATDDIQLQNISLYITNSTNQSFAYNQSTNISGTSNSSNWTLEFAVGNYTWNCLVYNNNSLSVWATNNSFILDYTAAAEETPASSSSSSGGGSSGGGSSLLIIEETTEPETESSAGSSTEEEISEDVSENEESAPEEQPLDLPTNFVGHAFDTGTEIFTDYGFYWILFFCLTSLIYITYKMIHWINKLNRGHVMLYKPLPNFDQMNKKEIEVWKGKVKLELNNEYDLINKEINKIKSEYNNIKEKKRFHKYNDKQYNVQEHVLERELQKVNARLHGYKERKIIILDVTKDKLMWDDELKNVQKELKNVDAVIPERQNIIRRVIKKSKTFEEKVLTKEYNWIANLLRKSISFPNALISALLPKEKKQKSPEEIIAENKAVQDVIRISKKIEGDKPRPTNELLEIEKELAKLNEEY